MGSVAIKISLVLSIKLIIHPDGLWLDGIRVARHTATLPLLYKSMKVPKPLANVQINESAKGKDEFNADVNH